MHARTGKVRRRPGQGDDEDVERRGAPTVIQHVAADVALADQAPELESKASHPEPQHRVIADLQLTQRQPTRPHGRGMSDLVQQDQQRRGERREHQRENRVAE
jgi:hypothetical protein